ncbi:dihydrofolate reductase [Cellvibrio mixtus]|uniref:dihydrofolate reductase n=1 Tax=Cellvibrio mixtus TaxID=39650 RepID=UPI0005873A06|nr:dihydrofolate reductase [Cellvibrio mixtus]
MKLAIIVAAARNGTIGRNNQLPWHLPQDLKYFKSVTLGKPVIMGRKTYESIGRPLPGRTNIVITRQPDWQAVAGVVVVSSLEQAIAAAENVVAGAADAEAMIIGGAEIYQLALGRADRVYLTQIEVDIDGDASFPSLSPALWQRTSAVTGDPAAELPHTFCVYERHE